MVNNKIAQRAVAAGLSGLMAFGAAAPAALAYTNYNAPFKWVKTTSSDDSTHWKRLAGNDRYGTMKKIVESYNEVSLGFWESIRKGFNNKDYYNYHSTVVLASGDNYPDALAANGLAGYLTNINLYQGDFQSVPVLITKSNSLSTETKDLLKGMQVQNVIIMGGTAAVSQDVEEAINKMGIGTSRVAGADRQETSVKAMQRINGNWESRDKTYDLIIASGSNYADALSISPYAYRMGTPIILTDKDGKLTDQEVEAIKANDKIKEIVIVGGTEAVKDEVLGQIGTIKNNRAGMNIVRVAGADRYDTSAKIAQFELNEWKNWSIFANRGGFTLNHAIVATGENFPDALVGGQLAGGVNAPWLQVEDFNWADYNMWTPCPLLLTKDGNTQAEGIISQGIAYYDVEIGTATLLTAKDWIDTLNGWYNGSVKTLPFQWVDTYVNTALSWYANSPIMYIRDKVIDWNAGYANATSDVTATFTTELGVDLPVEVAVEWDAVKKEPVVTITAGKEPADCKVRTYDGGTTTNGSFTVVSGTIAPESIKGSDPVKIALSTATWETADSTVTASKIDEIVLTQADKDAIKQAIDSLTSKVTSGTPDKQTKTVTLSSKVNAEYRKDIKKGSAQAFDWENGVLGYIETDEDFYGIILGGKQAVSNDKRDDLEDAVKMFGDRTQVRTLGDKVAGTIRRLDSKHNVEYSWNLLTLEDTGKFKGTEGVATAGCAGCVADVYHIYGTDSHAVAVFSLDAKGNRKELVKWLYYYGKDSMLETDWNVDVD